MSDPQGSGLPALVESAARYTDFELHVMWPQSGAFHVIVEGDLDVEPFVGLLSEYLAGGGWEAEVTRVWSAENPPHWLDAGKQAQWVIEQATPQMATEGEGRTCDLCQWVGVPPHGPPCDAEKLDDGSFTVGNYPPPGSRGGGTSEVSELDLELTRPVPARARAT